MGEIVLEALVLTVVCQKNEKAHEEFLGAGGHRHLTNLISEGLIGSSLGSHLVLFKHNLGKGLLVHSRVISRFSLVSVHGIPASSKDVEVVLGRLGGFLGGSIHLNRALHDCHHTLLTLLHDMRDVAHHTQQGDRVLLVFRNDPCGLILELRFYIGRTVLEYQVVRPGPIFNLGVHIILPLLLCTHEQVRVELPFDIIYEADIHLIAGKPLAGLDHEILILDLIFREVLVVLSHWTYGLQKSWFYHILHYLHGNSHPIHMPRTNVLQ